MDSTTGNCKSQSGVTPGATPGTTPGTTPAGETKSAFEFVNQLKTAITNIACALFCLVQTLAAGIAALFIIFSGVKYMTSGDDAASRAEVKNRIVYALIGLLVVVLACPLIEAIFDGTKIGPCECDCDTFQLGIGGGSSTITGTGKACEFQRDCDANQYCGTPDARDFFCYNKIPNGYTAGVVRSGDLKGWRIPAIYCLDASTPLSSCPNTRLAHYPDSSTCISQTVDTNGKCAEKAAALDTCDANPGCDRWSQYCSSLDGRCMEQKPAGEECSVSAVKNPNPVNPIPDIDQQCDGWCLRNWRSDTEMVDNGYCYAAGYCRDQRDCTPDVRKGSGWFCAKIPGITDYGVCKGKLSGGGYCRDVVYDGRDSIACISTNCKADGTCKDA